MSGLLLFVYVIAVAVFVIHFVFFLGWFLLENVRVLRDWWRER